MEEDKKIQTCPACGKTVHEQSTWVHCPYFKGQLICMEHCSKCKYNKNEFHCSYILERIRRREYYNTTKEKSVQAPKE